MLKFAVHYWINGRNETKVIEAANPDDARAAFKKDHPRREILKVKLVRS